MDTTLFLAALLPAIVLCVYVFKKDRVEKEPIGLLVLLLVLGAVSCLPTIVAELVLGEALNGIFAGSIVIDEAGTTYFKSSFVMYAYQFLNAFVVVALSEEFFKLLFLKLATKNNKNFNCLFDGLIYAIFVSLGFAALENILYVSDGGLQVAVLRAVLSVPGHMFFAVLMGWHYSFWHIGQKAQEKEIELKARGIIPQGSAEFNWQRHKKLALLMPVLAHGFYDFCLFIGSDILVLVAIAFIIYMYVYCFGQIKKLSKYDTANSTYVTALLIKKYPQLTVDDINGVKSVEAEEIL